jgi:hypothetical protein
MTPSDEANAETGQPAAGSEPVDPASGLPLQRQLFVDANDEVIQESSTSSRGIIGAADDQNPKDHAEDPAKTTEDQMSGANAKTSDGASHPSDVPGVSADVPKESCSVDSSGSHSRNDTTDGRINKNSTGDIQAAAKRTRGRSREKIQPQEPTKDSEVSIAVSTSDGSATNSGGVPEVGSETPTKKKQEAAQQSRPPKEGAEISCGDRTDTRDDQSATGLLTQDTTHVDADDAGPPRGADGAGTPECSDQQNGKPISPTLGEIMAEATPAGNSSPHLGQVERTVETGGADEQEETWDLKKVFTVEELKHNPVKCLTSKCTLFAACAYASSLVPTDKWYTCLDCQVRRHGTG